MESDLRVDAWDTADGLTTVRRRPRPHADVGAWLRTLGDIAASAGRVLVRPGAAPPRERDPVLHRHLLLVVLDAADAAATGAWLRAAARTSPRGHAVWLCRPARHAQARPLADAAEDASAVADADARHVEHLLSVGRFAQADAYLAALRVTAVVTGTWPAGHVRLQLARLRFWQGRFEEGWRLVSRVRPSRASLLPRALLAWARGDANTLAMTARDGRAVRGGDADVFVAEVLAAAWTGEAAQVATLVARWRTSRAPASASPLTRLVAAEALWTTGQRGDALAWLTAGAWGVVDAPLAMLRLRLMARMAGQHDEGVDVRIRQIGAEGLDRWAQGSTGAYLLHALPALLEILNESDDEVAALAEACRWARQACGAQAVMFVSAEDGRILADAGSRTGAFGETERLAIRQSASAQVLPRPEGCLVVHPVRYGGARIGAVVMLAGPERQASACEAAHALAAVAASAVRGRLTMIATSASGEALAADILGRSPAMAGVRDAIARAAVTPFPVLIEGESGTGKELVARALHRLSVRRDRRLATLNCAALSDDLAEAELFGHSRGAFTGAVAPRAGLFEDAHGGTLFLDEVGELSPRAQAKLLRALQEREIRRVGENVSRAVDVRVIAATNRALTDMVTAGIFREDLVFRLAVVRLRLPPLRERSEDVPLLAHVFWRRLARETGKRAVLGADAVARLVCHRWPGNVRELQNVIAGLVVLAPTRGRVGARHVEQVLAHAGGRPLDTPVSLDGARAHAERRVVAAALARHGGRRVAAARELGLTRQGLAKAVRRLRLADSTAAEGVA